MSDGAATPHARLRRIMCFAVVTIAFSWTQWLAVIASQHGLLASQVSLGPLAIFGPLVGALVVTASEDRKRWFRSLYEWRIPLVVTLTATLLPPAVLLSCLALVTALTPGAPRVPAPQATTLVAVSAGMFLTAGVGEESGWRGFLLPELRKSVGPIAASVVVAIVWFAWHLPLFWVVGSTQQQLSASAFALGLLAYSLILTWLFEASGRSTLAAMVFHASANVCFWYALVFVNGLPQYPALSHAYVSAMALCAVVSAVLLVSRDHKASGRHSASAG